MTELKDRAKIHSTKKTLLAIDGSLNRFNNIELRKDLCCEELVNYICLEDSPIAYLSPTRSYVLVVSDGIVTLDIKFCPCCGTKFPEDLTNELTIILERLKLSYDDKKLPVEFRSSQWWKTLGL